MSINGAQAHHAVMILYDICTCYTAVVIYHDPCVEHGNVMQYAKYFGEIEVVNGAFLLTTSKCYITTG